MILLTSHLGSTPVAINPLQVTYVKDATQGCVVYFNGTSIHVANNYLEVVGSITAAKHQ
jgi:hypothetical protein